MTRVFINLLSNSVKFTADYGYVLCTVSNTTNSDVKIEIIDDGIGIPDDRIDEVLKPFEQSHTNHEIDEEGTGLGLPIVKFLIESHGGNFVLSSKYGVGTCATIYLPKNRILI